MRLVDGFEGAVVSAPRRAMWLCHHYCKKIGKMMLGKMMGGSNLHGQPSIYGDRAISGRKHWAGENSVFRCAQVSRLSVRQLTQRIVNETRGIRETMTAAMAKSRNCAFLVPAYP
jgi:hypothetical protein